MTTAATMIAPRSAFESKFNAAKRHSRLVRILRRALPTLAFLAVAFFIIRSIVSGFVPGLSIGNVSFTSEGIVLINPKLSGHDSSNRSYSVEANRAIQSFTNPKLITLEDVKADLVVSSTEAVTFTAARGVFDGAAEKADLKGNIRIQTVSGYSATLRSALIDFKAGTMVSNESITLTSPQVSISSDGISLSEKDRMMRFEGNVKITIHPKKR